MTNLKNIRLNFLRCTNRDVAPLKNKNITPLRGKLSPYVSSVRKFLFHNFSACLSVLIVLVCIKRDLWNRMKSSRFCDRWDKEGLLEQEERFIRKKKHKKKLGNKAKNFTEKYKLGESSTMLYTP